MGLYLVNEMFPSERILTREEVYTLYQNACKVVKYNVYCCYRLVDTELGQQRFLHIHDNDSSENDVCMGPFIIKWIAAINDKDGTIRFLPYLSYIVLSYSLDEHLDNYLNRCLYTLNIVPIELSDKWLRFGKHEVILRRRLTSRLKL